MHGSNALEKTRIKRVFSFFSFQNLENKNICTIFATFSYFWIRVISGANAPFS